MRRLLWGLGGWTVFSYILDVVVRPSLVARRAQKFARSSGKPVLNVGAGTPGSSVRTILLGPTTWGDVNMDIAAAEHVCTGENVCYGDAHKAPYPDRYFGAAILSHVLEHVTDPVAVMKEMLRVADRVYVIVPQWWAPHTWLHYGHRWFITNTDAYPVWNRTHSRMRLPVSLSAAAQRGATPVVELDDKRPPRRWCDGARCWKEHHRPQPRPLAENRQRATIGHRPRRRRRPG